MKRIDSLKYIDISCELIDSVNELLEYPTRWGRMRVRRSLRKYNSLPEEFKDELIDVEEIENLINPKYKHPEIPVLIMPPEILEGDNSKL